MTHSHRDTVIPSANRVLSIDDDTQALFHYDLNASDVLYGTPPKHSGAGLRFEAERYQVTGDQYKIQNTLTLAAWVYPEAAVSDDRGIIIKGRESDGYYLTLNTSNQLSVYWYGKSPTGYHTSSGVCPTRQWTHIAAVWSETELKLYINGVLDKTIQCTGRGTMSTVVEVGMEATRRQFKGLAADIGIWGEAKDDMQIASIMNGYRDTYGLAGFWPMQTDDGDVIYDVSEHQSDMVIIGGTPKGLGNGGLNYTLLPYEGRFGGAVAIEDSTENLFDSKNGRSSNMTPYGTTRPSVELVNMDTPFGNEAWKVTIPANNDTTYYGCRVQSNSFATEYDGRPYSYYTYMSGDTDAIHIYPTGNRGMTSSVRLSERDIGHWECYGRNAISTNAGGSGSTYMAYYIKDSKPYERTIYISALQIEQKEWSSSYTEGARSTSSLEYSMQEIGIDPIGDWTIAGWFKRWPDAGQWGALFGMGNYHELNESEFQVWSNHGDVFKMWSHNNRSGRARNLFTPNDGELSEWFYVAVTHEKSTGTYHIYVWTKDRYVSNTWTISHGHPIPDRLYIGMNGGGRRLNGLIDEIRIDNVVRTEKELTAWRHSNSPFWPRGIYRAQN